MALAELALDRLERLGPRYNAVVTLTRERCLEQARRAERELRRGKRRGPVHGIPYGAKDLLATSGGIPTSWGLGSRSNYTFDHDAAVIERLAASGAPWTTRALSHSASDRTIVRISAISGRLSIDGCGAAPQKHFGLTALSIPCDFRCKLAESSCYSAALSA